MEKLTVLYNDKCPVCSLEIDHYRALCEKRTLPLAFEEISREGEVLQSSGLSVDEAKKRLHIRLPSGEIRVGVDAFLALWAEMPGYRILDVSLHVQASTTARVWSTTGSWRLHCTGGISAGCAHIMTSAPATSETTQPIAVPMSTSLG